MADVELSGHHLGNAIAYFLGASNGRVRDFFDEFFDEGDQKATIIAECGSLCRGWRGIPNCEDYSDEGCQEAMLRGITPEQAREINTRCAQKYGFPVGREPSAGELFDGLYSLVSEDSSFIEIFVRRLLEES